MIPDEIEHNMDQAYTRFLDDRLEAVRLDRGSESSALKAMGFRKPDLSQELIEQFDEYYLACIQPKLNEHRKAIFHAVATEILRIIDSDS